MAVEVHTETLKRRFVADWLSVACLVNFLIVLGAAILPLYISWASSLWIREKPVLDQLDLKLDSRLVVEARGMRSVGTERVPFTSLWSTSPVANSLYGSLAVRPMVVRATPVDRNGDGVMDEAGVSITIPLAADESVYGVTALVFGTARLHSSARFSMDSALLASLSSGVPISRAWLDGDVTLLQRDSLPRPSGGVYTPYLGQALQALDSAVSIEQVTVGAYVSALRARNHSLSFTVPAPVVEPDTTVPTSGGQPDVAQAAALQPRTVQVDITARLPLAPVYVRATIPEELKWGWMQYLSFLVITVYLAHLLRTALFGWRLVPAAVLVDAPRAATKLHVA